MLPDRLDNSQTRQDLPAEGHVPRQLTRLQLASATSASAGTALLVGTAWAGSVSNQVGIVLAMAVAAGVSLALAVVLIYLSWDIRRRTLDLTGQRTIELALEREHNLRDKSAREWERLHARDQAEILQALRDRLQASVLMLGSDEAIVRASAAQELARLSDDAVQNEHTDIAHECVSLLCTYLRLPAADTTAEWKVRERIVELIAEHLRDSTASTSWSRFPLDFSGAEFQDGSFAFCTFGMHANFADARFSGEFTFNHADFEGAAHFAGASFSGLTTSFDRVAFRDYANFDGASFAGRAVSFNEAQFETVADFDSATFASRLVLFRNVAFDRATFNNSTFERGSRIAFSGAQVARSISFLSADFAGGVVDLVDTEFREGTKIDFQEPQQWLYGPLVPWGVTPPTDYAADHKLTVLPVNWPPTPISEVRPDSSRAERGEHLALRIPAGIRDLDDLSLFLGDLDQLYRECARAVYSVQDPLPLAVSYIATGSLIIEVFEQYGPYLVGGAGGGILGVIGRALVSGKVERLATLLPRLKSAQLRAQADIHHAQADIHRGEADIQDAKNEMTRKEIEGVRLEFELRRAREEADEAAQLQQVVGPTVERIRQTAPHLEIAAPRDEPDGDPSPR